LSLLIAGSDAVISLHRSEGFGLVLAEAMLAEVPVIATAWSGNTDFIDDDCAIPIPYKLIPATDAQGLYDAPESHWAEPDTEAAARALRRLRRSPDEHRALAVRGRERAVKRFGLTNYQQAVAPGLPHLSGAATRGSPTP
jgi:glycosyltransferase involved in cell wall biosynthesis